MNPATLPEVFADHAAEQARSLADVGMRLLQEGLRALLVERVRVLMEGHRPCHYYPPELEVRRGAVVLATVVCQRGGFLVVTQSGRALTADMETAVEAVVSG